MKEEKKEEPGKKKKGMNLEITELFGAKKGKKGFSDFHIGVIHREKDAAGNEVAVNGNIRLEGEGVFWSRDTDQEKYGENIDNILELRIDYGIHNDPGISSKIAEEKFFHN